MYRLKTTRRDATQEPRSTRRRWRGLIAALTMFGATIGSAGVIAAPAYAAGTTTVRVDPGSIRPNGTWGLDSTSASGSYAFVPGPATPPDGSGSLELSIASGQHEWMNNYAYGRCSTGPACNNPATMTAITDIDELGFSTYRASGSTFATLNVEVWTTGTGGYTTFVFVPNAASVTTGAWQTWDALNVNDGSWYSTKVLPGLFNCAPQSAGCTASWSDIQGAYPSGKVFGGIGANVGTGGTYTGNIDDLTVGVSGDTTIFNLEPEAACTSICYVNGTTGNDLNSGQSNDPLKTIQAGADAVLTGGTVQIAAGTYAENVTIGHPLVLAGASQAATKIVPAVSDPDCGGAGGSSLCPPGGSNVILVRTSNVTIHDLTVDGDNPALTSGKVFGGADIDARNGIITDHTSGVYQALSVHDVTVENIYLRGIYASTGGSFNFTNNTVDNVQASPASIAMFNSGGSGTMSGNHVSNTNDALSANHSKGTQFTGNTITAAQSGIHTDNAGDGGGTADVISGNSVSACLPVAGDAIPNYSLGFWSFVPYIAPTISNNTVSGCGVGLAAFGSCNLAGTNFCPGGVVPTTKFTGNTVTGASGSRGLLVTTDTLGNGAGDVKVSADHNTISGNDDGVFVAETSAGTHATVAANRNSLGGNTNSGVDNTGTTTVDATCNWWGQASGPATGDTSGLVTVAPWLVVNNLNGNCLPVVKIGTGTKTVTEGNSGTKGVLLTVTLDRPSSKPVTVHFQTVDGTTGPADYVHASNTLTFSPGQVSKNIIVQINGDTAVEGNETFSVNLSSPTNSVLGNATESVIITNDDKPTMTVNNPLVVEGRTAVYTIRVSQPYFQAIVVHVSSANGSATAPADYTAVPAGTTVTIPAGATAATISVATHLDHTTEPDQTFTATFTSTGVTNSPRIGTTTIKANAT